jgi:hypothetical protein
MPAEWEQKEMALRDRLDSATFEAAWKEGYDSPLEQVVRYALAEDGDDDPATPDGAARVEWHEFAGHPLAIVGVLQVAGCAVIPGSGKG